MGVSVVVSTLFGFIFWPQIGNSKLFYKSLLYFFKGSQGLPQSGPSVSRLLLGLSFHQYLNS